MHSKGVLVECLHGDLICHLKVKSHKGRGRRRSGNTTSGVRVLYGFVWEMVGHLVLYCELSGWKRHCESSRMHHQGWKFYRNISPVSTPFSQFDIVVVPEIQQHRSKKQK